jgi:hypothetical protein
MTETKINKWDPIAKKIVVHTPSGSKLEYEKVGKDRTMHDSNQEKSDHMEMPKALETETQTTKTSRIRGYRELNETEITLMNAAKDKATEVGDICDALERTSDIDRRWLAIARTQLQQGFMALVRSIAKPKTF